MDLYYCCIAASLRCTCSALENPASLPTFIKYRSPKRCNCGIQRLGIVIVALHVDVNVHSVLIHVSGIKCSCSLYRSWNNAVPLPIASCACPNEVLRSLLVASSCYKWSSSIVYLSSFVLTANSGSSSPPRRAGPDKLVLATFR